MAGLGFNFTHTYTTLPAHSYTRLDPSAVARPALVLFNETLAQQLGLTLAHQPATMVAELFSGNRLPDGAQPIAQAYAGHQFGHFNMLGDGRAHLLGEQQTPAGAIVDIQLKGSGQTPYSRRGDGRAALAPMLREYLISEAMQALGISTTRSLAVVTTGEQVYRDTALPGAILTRVAASHIRVGTFEYFAARRDIVGLRQLADYTINRHYPDLKNTAQPYLALLQAIAARQMALVVAWLRVGFIHGVMNTDNMAVSGETIDYGPCAFMDAYDPQTVFSSIDRDGRYAYGNQPLIAQWNLARLAEAMLPLFHDDAKQAVPLAEAVIESFTPSFNRAWLTMMRQKLGLAGEAPEDEQLVGDLLNWMQMNHADYTNTFLALETIKPLFGKPYQQPDHQAWRQRWQARLAKNTYSPDVALAQMRQTNPRFIPRNQRVEEALAAAMVGDLTKLKRLLAALARPYQDNATYLDLQQVSVLHGRSYQTFCGT